MLVITGQCHRHPTNESLCWAVKNDELVICAGRSVAASDPESRVLLVVVR